jgi:ABC-type multidrug transport system ATPase subunit
MVYRKEIVSRVGQERCFSLFNRLSTFSVRISFGIVHITSGAGKTTLLNALGNRAPYANLLGDVQFGKRRFTASDLFFVPQFDEVNGNFTVSEQIELVGLLKVSGV